jgi:hypothetical protein
MGFLVFELLVNNASSDTLAFSLHLVPFLPAADSPATHAGSSASPSLAHPPWAGPTRATVSEGACAGTSGGRLCG